jgi:hypothetical protein
LWKLPKEGKEANRNEFPSSCIACEREKRNEKRGKQKPRIKNTIYINMKIT